MTEVIFISETRLRQFTDLNDNVSSELVKNGIREAQDIQIQRILGTKLYNRLIAGVIADDLTTVETTLMNNYIADALIYWSYYYSLDAIYLRPRNNGLVRPNGGENSVDVELVYYDRKRGTVRKKAEWYSELLATYLQEEISLFPELSESTKLYQKSSNTNSQYANNPFVMRDSSRGQGNLRGIPRINGDYPC